SVHRRVLAHQYHIQLGQRRHMGRPQCCPVLQIIPHHDLGQSRKSIPLIQKQILQLYIEQRPTTALSGQHHGEGTVFFRVDPGNGIHDHTNTNTHRKIYPRLNLYYSHRNIEVSCRRRPLPLQENSCPGRPLVAPAQTSQASSSDDSDGHHCKSGTAPVTTLSDPVCLHSAPLLPTPGRISVGTQRLPRV